MKFFIYARKSTEDEARQVLSIQSQLDELREYARKESLQVVHEYTEAMTAKEPGRPVFNEMMESVPGPNGLSGAYPCRLGESGAEVVLPSINLEEAIDINRAGGKYDGIERIKDDGTVVYCHQNVEYMREVVGYDCKELKPRDSEKRAKELEMLLKKLYDKYKVSQ